MLTGVVVFIYPNSAEQIAVTLAIAFIFALHLNGWIHMALYGIVEFLGWPRLW